MTSKDLLKVAVVLAVTASVGSAFASEVTSAIQMGPSGSFAPSANVTMHIFSGATSYASDSMHYSGNRAYFGNSSDPKIYYTTKDVGNTSAIATTSTDAPNSSWSSL